MHQELGRNSRLSPQELASQSFPSSISNWENGTRSLEGNVHLIMTPNQKSKRDNNNKKKNKEGRIEGKVGIWEQISQK